MQETVSVSLVLINSKIAALCQRCVNKKNKKKKQEKTPHTSLVLLKVTSDTSRLGFATVARGSGSGLVSKTHILGWLDKQDTRSHAKRSPEGGGGAV